MCLYPKVVHVYITRHVIFADETFHFGDRYKSPQFSSGFSLLQAWQIVSVVQVLTLPLHNQQLQVRVDFYRYRYLLLCSLLMAFHLCLSLDQKIVNIPGTRLQCLLHKEEGGISVRLVNQLLLTTAPLFPCLRRTLNHRLPY